MPVACYDVLNTRYKMSHKYALLRCILRTLDLREIYNLARPISFKALQYLQSRSSENRTQEPQFFLNTYVVENPTCFL